MAFAMKFTRPPTQREKEAIRAQRAAKAAKETQRVDDAVRKALAKVDADAKADEAVKVRPRAFGTGERFRAVDIVWTEWETGATHADTIATGFVPNDDATFAEIKAHVDDTLAFHATTGERYSKFYVYRGEQRVGCGFFESNVKASDIPFMFAKLAEHGLDGHVAYTPGPESLLLDEYILEKLNPIIEDVVAASFETIHGDPLRDFRPRRRCGRG